MTKKDLRVIRSQMMIKNAFVDLIEEAGYDSITITDIAERAMINRKTFYLHYDSKAALFDEILNEALLVLTRNLRYEGLNFDAGLFSVDLHSEIEIIVHNASTERRLFKVLFNDASNSGLIAKITERLQNRVFNKVLAANPAAANQEIPSDLLTLTLIAALVESLKWWLNQEQYTEKEAADIFFKLISTGFTESIGFQQNL